MTELNFSPQCFTKRILGEVKINRICGIYCLKNNINNKVYVGQSVDILRRKKDHINRLRNNRHDNKYLQYSWGKYKENNFDFFILEECSKENLDEKEKYWINKLKSNNPEFGYNLTIGGKSFVVDENLQGFIGSIWQPILQFSLDGVLIKRWDKISDIFGKNKKWSQTPLWNHLRDSYKYHSFHKCIWIREIDFSETLLNELIYLAKHKTSNANRKIPIVQYNINGEPIKKWESISEASRNGFNKECIMRHMKNNTQYKGYYFKKVDT